MLGQMNIPVELRYGTDRAEGSAQSYGFPIKMLIAIGGVSEPISQDQ